MPSAAPSSASTSSARRASAAPSPADESLGVGESDPPDTLKEAASKFEEVLVRQFVEVMTKDMFSSSHAGKGGGNWMQSQRDRQRDLMTDMIADRLANADTLKISEKLAQDWGIAGPGAGAAPSTTTPADPGSPMPLDTQNSSRPLLDTPPTTRNEPHIDHAV